MARFIVFHPMLPSDVSKEEFYAAIKHMYPDRDTHLHKILNWQDILDQGEYVAETLKSSFEAKFDDYVALARRMKEKK